MSMNVVDRGSTAHFGCISVVGGYGSWAELYDDETSHGGCAGAARVRRAGEDIAQGVPGECACSYNQKHLGTRYLACGTITTT
jgi:hypothetical protein